MNGLVEIGLSNAVLATLIAAAAGVAALRNAHAGIVYALWLLVLVKLVTPPLVDVAVPVVEPFPPATRAAAVLEEANGTLATHAAPSEPMRHVAAHEDRLPADAATQAAEMHVPIESEPVVADLTDPAVATPGSLRVETHTHDLQVTRAENVAAVHGGNDRSNVARPADAAGLPSSARPPGIAIAPRTAASEIAMRWRVWLLGVWLFGSLVWLSVALCRIVRFHKLLRFARPASASLSALANSVAQAVGLRRTPEVLVLPAPVPPFMWPLGRRIRVVLPAQLCDEVSAESTRMLLAHEFMHVRRGDHWARLLELLATACFWWLPTLWWARRGLRHAEERCCDAGVVAHFPAEARNYADALLATVGFLSGPATRSLPVAASGLGELRFLERRLTAVMSRTPQVRLTLTARLLIAALAVIVLPWGAVAARSAPGANEPQAAANQSDDAAAARAVNRQDKNADGATVSGAAGDGSALPKIGYTLERLPAQCIATYKELSPDESRVAFAGAVLTSEGERKYGVYVVELATGAVQQVFPAAVKTRPAWSPDSRQIAFGNNPSYGNVYPLVIVDVESGAVEETGAQGVGIDWSPDGRELAVSTEFHQAGSWVGGVPADGRIGVWNTQQRKMRFVSPPGYNLYDRQTGAYAMSGGLRPRWSPDGRLIAYVQRTSVKRGGRDEERSFDVFVVSADGKELRRAATSSQLDFLDHRWQSETELVIAERQDTMTVIVAELSVLSAKDMPSIPADIVAAVQAQAEARARAADYDVAPILAANRPWQRPSLAGIQSVQFTHRMRPKRLDERFAWRSDGACFSEVVFRDDERAAEEVGRIALVAPLVQDDPEDRLLDFVKYDMKGTSRYPNTTAFSRERAEQFARERLQGTRANFVALDWGRDPDRFHLIDVKHADDGKTATLVLEPPRDRQRRRYVLNAGTMFDTTSWAYVHDLVVGRSELTIDTQTHRILREVDYGRGGVLCEIALDEWQEVGDGGAVPLQVRLKFPQNEFDVVQNYQWRPEGLWILRRAEAKFAGHEPQFAEVDELVVNGPAAELTERIARIERLDRAFRAPTTKHVRQLVPNLQPFLLGLTETLRWQRGTPITDLLHSLRFTVGGVNEVRSYSSLRLQAKIHTPPGSHNAEPGTQLLLSLFDSQSRPVGAFPLPVAVVLGVHPQLISPPKMPEFHIMRDKESGVVTVDLGRAPGYRAATTWNLTLLEPDGATATLDGGRLLPLAAAPFPNGVPQVVDVSADEDGKTRIRSLGFERTEKDHDAIRVELVSEAKYVELQNYVSCVVVDGDGVPIAVAGGHTSFRAESSVAVDNQLLLDFGRVLPNRRSLYVLLGMQSQVIGGPMGSVWGRYAITQPVFPVERLLGSPAADVIQAGLVELDRELRHHVSELIEDAEYDDEDRRVARIVVPHRDRLFQLRETALPSEAHALWCILAGHTGDVRFVEPLKLRLDHENAAVRDAAAIGLGLLGDATGLEMVRRVAEQPDVELSSEQPERLRQIQRRTDARLALGRLEGLVEP